MIRARPTRAGVAITYATRARMLRPSVAHGQSTRVCSSPQALETLRGALAFQPKYRGLSLKRALPEYGLFVGARLMADGGVNDVHEFENVPPGTEVVFFNRIAETGLTLITPLFEIKGFSMNCVCLDVMHVLDLGVLQWLVVVPCVGSAPTVDGVLGARRAV